MVINRFREVEGENIKIAIFVFRIAIRWVELSEIDSHSDVFSIGNHLRFETVEELELNLTCISIILCTRMMLEDGIAIVKVPVTDGC